MRARRPPALRVPAPREVVTADHAQVVRLLAKRNIDIGNHGSRVDDFRCRMLLGASVDNTVEFMQGTDMAATLTADASDEAAGAAWEAVHAVLAPYEGPDGVGLGVAAWIVTATKP
jgi:hypothetical protein